jgi:hypothetical protein
MYSSKDPVPEANSFRPRLQGYGRLWQRVVVPAPSLCSLAVQSRLYPPGQRLRIWLQEAKLVPNPQHWEREKLRLVPVLKIILPDPNPWPFKHLSLILFYVSIPFVLWFFCDHTFKNWFSSQKRLIMVLDNRS